MDYQPDLIIELGRGIGNSTACFLEVCHRLGGIDQCRLLSLCLSPDWMARTAKRIQNSYATDPSWFAPGTIEQTDILEYDITPLLDGKSKVLLFWDAHGFEVAERVLANWMPLLERCSHRVVMHDISDTRYEGCNPGYDNSRIWHGESAAHESMFLGHIFTRVAQAISVVDFSSRNNIPFHSASESLSQEIGESPEKLAELKDLIGDDAARMDAHWFWFTLEEGSAPFFYPQQSIRIIEEEMPSWLQSREEVEQRQVRRTPSAIKTLHKQRFEGFAIQTNS